MTDDSPIPEPTTRGWWRATVAAILLSGACLALAFVSLADNGMRIDRVDLPEEIARCAGDADCVLVDRIGCCACQSGGARWAINKDAGDALRRFLKHTCRASGTCVQVNACRDDLAPSCVDQHCVATVEPLHG